MGNIDKQKGKIKNIEKNLKFELGDGYPILELIMKRNGQESECESDCILLSLQLRIPARQSGLNVYLPAELCFGKRVFVFGEGLYPHWGYDGGSGDVKYRCKTRNFSGTHWNPLFEEAEKYGKAEIKNIIDAIEKRRIALEEAEV